MKPKTTPATPPPFSNEAEQRVLGAMLKDPEKACAIALETLQDKDFYEGKNRLLFQVIKQLHSDKIPVDLVSIKSHLSANGEKNSGVDTYFIAQVMQDTVTTANIEYHVKIVKEDSQRRALINGLGTIQEQAPGADLAILSSDIRKALQELEKRQDGGLRSLSVFLDEAVEDIQAKILRRKKGAVLKDIRTGFYSLDSITGGMDRGELIVLGARPSVGKSSLAVNIALDVASQGKGAVAVFSLEMLGRKIAARILFDMADFPLHSVSTGDIPDEKMKAVIAAASEMYERIETPSDIFIEDKRGITIEQIAARAERLKFKVGELGLIVIDYLQILGASPGLERNSSKYAQVTHASNKAQELAGTMNCPVLLCSQLNRDSDKTDREPRLSDLRESGAIEQDADMVWLIHREKDMSATQAGYRKLIVAKNRNGATDETHLYFEPSVMRFSDNGGEDAEAPF